MKMLNAALLAFAFCFLVACDSDQRARGTAVTTPVSVDTSANTGNYNNAGGNLASYVETTKAVLQPLYTKYNYQFVLIADKLSWCATQVEYVPAKQNLPDDLQEMLKAMSDVVSYTSLATYYHNECIAGRTYSQYGFTTQAAETTNVILSNLFQDLLDYNNSLDAQCKVPSYDLISVNGQEGWRALLARIATYNNNGTCRALMPQSTFLARPQLYSSSL